MSSVPRFYRHPPPGLKFKLGRFGRPDAQQLVGESPCLWRLRMELARLAQEPGHVLICGASGTGKELAAGAIHRLSPQGQKELVARNAATFPSELIDAELFGNLKNYPNVGMQERPGLLGQADGGTLFLDELGELPKAAQTHLLRVLDAGEYQRLGEATTRRARVRFLGATHQPTSVLREDFAARFDWTLEVPGLNERREDIPLLVRELFRRQAQQNPELARRYCENGAPFGMPRVSPQLMSALVMHLYTTHVRELAGLLRRVVRDSGTLPYLELTAVLRRELGWLERPSLRRLGQASDTPRAFPQDVRRTVEEPPSFQEQPTLLCVERGVDRVPMASPRLGPPLTEGVERWLDGDSLARLTRFRAVGFSASAYAVLEGCRFCFSKRA
ncbi:MAG: sigma-54-dependent transcriptional regulator [Myxococcota bacterium]